MPGDKSSVMETQNKLPARGSDLNKTQRSGKICLQNDNNNDVYVYTVYVRTGTQLVKKLREKINILFSGDKSDLHTARHCKQFALSVSIVYGLASNNQF